MAGSQEPAGEGVPFDTSRAHMARVYDFWLGGKDNFAADRPRATGAIVERAASVLDFGQPVAVMLLGILQGIPDQEDPGAIVGRLMDAVPQAAARSRPARRLRFAAQDPGPVPGVLPLPALALPVLRSTAPPRRRPGEHLLMRH